MISKLLPIICILSILFCYSCQKSTPQLTIPEELLVTILFDAQVAEAALQSVGKETKDSLAELYYEQIGLIHGIPDSILWVNIEILKGNPKLAHRVYSSVIELQKQVEKDRKETK